MSERAEFSSPLRWWGFLLIAVVAVLIALLVSKFAPHSDNAMFPSSGNDERDKVLMQEKVDEFQSTQDWQICSTASWVSANGWRITNESQAQEAVIASCVIGVGGWITHIWSKGATHQYQPAAVNADSPEEILAWKMLMERQSDRLDR